MNIDQVNTVIRNIASGTDSVELFAAYETALEDEMNEYNEMLYACEASYDNDAAYYGEMQ